MATAAGEGRSTPFQETIESLVTCSICLEKMVDPRTLSCLHSFCKSCLEHVEAYGRRLSCPLCREDTYLPRNGIEGLKRNFFVTQLLDLEKRENQVATTAEKSLDCSVCQKYIKEEDSLWLCKQCDVHKMCFRCANRHLEANDDHEVLPEETQSTSQKCVLHEFNTEDRWCLSCDEALCAECESQFHRSCRRSKKILDLQTASHSKRIELMSLLAEGKRKLPVLESHLRTLTDKLSKKKAEETLMVLMVKKCKEKLLEQMKASMDNEEERCVTQAKEHVAEVEKQGAFTKRLITEDVELLDRVVEESASLLSRNDNDTMIMLSSDTIKSSMAGLLTAESEPNFVPRLSVPLLSKNLQKLCEQFASKVIGDVVIERNYREISTPMHEFKVTDFQPTYITVDKSGIYLSDNKKHCIRVYSLGGQKVRAFGKNEVSYPAGLTVNSEGLVFVNDAGNKRICVYGEAGGVVKTIEQRALGDNIKLSRLSGIVVTPDNKIIVTEVSENKVLIIDGNTGELVTSFGERGSELGKLSCPSYVTFDPIHKRILVSEQGNNRIQVFNSDGEYITAFGKQGKGAEDFDFPTGLAVDQFGNIVIGDYRNSCLKFYSENLSQFHVLNMYNSKPSDIACRQDGHVFVTCERSKTVTIY